MGWFSSFFKDVRNCRNDRQERLNTSRQLPIVEKEKLLSRVGSLESENNALKRAINREKCNSICLSKALLSTLQLSQSLHGKSNSKKSYILARIDRFTDAAEEIVMRNIAKQKAWAKCHGFRIYGRW